jgi:hypothetical protein
MTGPANVGRLAVVGLFVALIPVGGQLSALLLGTIVAALLTALAVLELRAPDTESTGAFAGGRRRRPLPYG